MRLLSLLWALSLIGVIPCPESVQLSNEASNPCSVTRIRYVRDASLGPEAYEIRSGKYDILLPTGHGISSSPAGISSARLQGIQRPRTCFASAVRKGWISSKGTMKDGMPSA